MMGTVVGPWVGGLGSCGGGGGLDRARASMAWLEARACHKRRRGKEGGLHWVSLELQDRATQPWLWSSD